jgi:cobalt-zinc-cadmium efflux system outer membrane protein
MYIHFGRVQSFYKYILRFCCTLFVVASLAPVALAEKIQQTATLSLGQAMQQVLEQHPALQVFPLREQKLEGQKKTANLRPAYVVGADIENLAGTGDLSGIKSLETSVTLSSVLELGDKRQSRVDLVEQQSGVVRVERQIKALDLLGEVTRSYLLTLNSQERVQLAQAGLELAQTTLTEVKKRVNSAVAPKADLWRSEAAVEKADLTLSAEQRQLEIHRMLLANLWGSYQPTFKLVSGSLYDLDSAIPFDRLFEQVQQNPQIEFFATQARVRDAEVRLARTEQVADVTWSVGIRRDEGVDSTAFMAGVSIPLFSQQRAEGKIEAALAARNEITYQRQDLLLQLHSQLYRAYLGREQAIETTYKLQQTIIPKLMESLKQTQTGYQ